MTKIVIMSKGRYWGNNSGWVYSKDHAFDFLSYYGNPMTALTRAVESSRDIRTRLSRHLPNVRQPHDAIPVVFYV